MDGEGEASEAAWWQDDEEEEGGRPWYLDAHDLELACSDQGAHRFTLLVLHSCSGGPDDFTAFFHRLELPFRRRVRVVVPCAPLRVENHYGWEKELNSWFEYEGNDVRHMAQLEEQRARVLELLEQECQLLPGCDPRRLVLLGLSQGAALAVDVALRAQTRVGGVVALRGMALPSRHLKALPQHDQGRGRLRLLAFNGARDWLCPPEEARASYEALRPYGVDVAFETDEWLAHGCARGRQKLSGPELQKVSAFLKESWSCL